MTVKIYTKLEEIIDPAHSVLVMWDVQNALVDRIFNRDGFLESTKKFLNGARQKGVPIVYSKIVPLPREYEAPSRMYMMMKRFGLDDPLKIPRFLEPGTPEAEIHSDLKPRKGEPVLDKHTASIFVGTHFERMMLNRGIKTIIFSGISTEMGIASSARDAINRGFYTVVVSDCVSTMDQTIHEAALNILSRVCIVTSSEKIRRSWA